MFSFQSRTKIIETNDYIKEILLLLREERAKNILVVFDPAIKKPGRLKDLKKCLKRQKRACVYLQSPPGEPLTTDLDRMGKPLKKMAPGLIIGIGGGSTLDISKALSVLAVNPGSTARYHGKPSQIRRAVPKIMIPTTAGTGSEVTSGAVLTNPKTNFKRALGGASVCPEYAILDASLTLSMPRAIMFATAMDALAHAVESYVCKSANAITRMYSRTAYSLIENNLPILCRSPKNIRARKNILLASTLAGVAIFNSNTGAAHALAYPMGIYLKMPHGLATAVLLPEIIKLNMDKGCLEYAGLHGKTTNTTKKQKIYLSKKVLIFCRKILIKSKLNNFFIKYTKRINIDELAAKGMDLLPAIKNNPTRVNKKDFKKILIRLTKNSHVFFSLFFLK